MAFTPGVPANESFSPFIPQSPLLASGTINFDLIINEANPGVIFQGTEPNALVEVLREVGGSWWFVTNADWVQTAASFQQNAPCNPSLPAYAMVRTSDGKIQNFYAPATLAAGTNVSWQEVTEITGNGNLKVLSKTLTSGTNEPFITAQGTWAVGAGVTANAFVVNLIDTSSNAGSALQLFNVGGVPKWQVLKDGTLNVGIVPWARITGAPAAPVTSVSGSGPGINVAPTTGAVIVSLTHGDYVDIGNAQTITGPKEFTSLVDADGGLDVEGGTTTDTLHTTSTAQIDGALTAASEHITGNLQVDGTSNVNGTETVGGLHDTGNAQIDGTLNAGATTVSSLHDTGNAQVDGTLTTAGLVLTGSTPTISYVGFGVTLVDTYQASALATPKTYTIPLNTPAGHTWSLSIVIIADTDAGSSGTFTITPGTGMTGIAFTQGITGPPGGGIIGFKDSSFHYDGSTMDPQFVISYSGTNLNSVATLVSLVRTS